ncbi:hypothetical protein [Saccharicrinis sp. FJH54]|uniref:hypothetical protein n=1 Tax=Saccharicrinis sp. FJH54 TaxID=3344665 RepID=UPI0035D49764
MAEPDDKNRIVDLLKTKINIHGLRLPRDLEFSLVGGNLVIKLGSFKTKEGTQYCCLGNMQTDRAAFEGWSICLKLHLEDKIDKVFLKWDRPANITQNQQQHYNRFLYRVIKFSALFKWFHVENHYEAEIKNFKEQLSKLIINVPLSQSGFTTDKSSNEAKIEYANQNRDCIKQKFNLSVVDHQLPVGVKRDGNNFFTGRSSAIDIWGINKNNDLFIFELKYKNKKIGIITELLFYTEVMHDVFILNNIGIPGKIREFRSADKLYEDPAKKIQRIEGYFLVDEIHPLFNKDCLKLLNENEAGIKFEMRYYSLQNNELLFKDIY